MVPNYTPAGWFECDLFAVTKAGFFHEYEIKMTKSDFAADKEKAVIKWGKYDPEKMRFDIAERRTKHELIELASETGPARFWYVMPDGLIAESEIPTWAGLKYATGTRGHINFKIVRTAPKLHGVKLSSKIIDHAHRVCYWRFWKELIKNERMRNDRARIVEMQT